MIAEVLARKLPDVMVSLSSEVSPQMREYERFNTTIANAYIKPLMKSYLGRLKNRLAAEGAALPCVLDAFWWRDYVAGIEQPNFLSGWLNQALPAELFLPQILLPSRSGQGA